VANLCVVGNCSVDLTIECSDQIIEFYELKRGESNNASFDSRYRVAFGEIISTSQPVMSFGGGGGNIASTYATLGGDVKLIGKVGKDIYGRQFVDDIERVGCHSELNFSSEHLTSQILVLVDPSKDRTFIIEPGANASIEVRDTTNDHYFCVDGHSFDYEVTSRNVLKEIANRQERGQQCIISAADISVVEHNREVFKSFFDFKETCLLIFSEAELVALLKQNISVAISELRDLGITALVTLGEKGTVVVSGGKSELVEAQKVRPVDVVNLVGAGDTFLGGFLFGLIEQHLDLVGAVGLGNSCASEVIKVAGARLENS